MRPLAFKLLTLALTAFLLLSFLSPVSLSAFGRLRTPELDEQPYPQAYRNASYFMVMKTSYGIVLIPIFVKPNRVSNTVSIEKPTASPRANEVVE